MMAPDYTHWHGMYEVAERFYNHLLPQAQAIVEKAAELPIFRPLSAVMAIHASRLA
jgi:hydroxylamine dehydrogenase